MDIAVAVHREAKTGVVHTSTHGPQALKATPNNTPTPLAPPLLSAVATNQGSNLVLCGNCNRKVVSSRFAQHLEKCLGRGRAASRLASRRGMYTQL